MDSARGDPQIVRMHAIPEWVAKLPTLVAQLSCSREQSIGYRNQRGGSDGMIEPISPSGGPAATSAPYLNSDTDTAARNNWLPTRR